MLGSSPGPAVATLYYKYKGHRTAQLLALNNKTCHHKSIIIPKWPVHSDKYWPKSRRLQPERQERGGPCWLLKLRWIGTQRVPLKVFLSWLVRWAWRASTRDFWSALAAIVGPVQNTFPHIHNFNFNFFVLITQQAGQANLAGTPVSLCVSVLATPWLKRYRYWNSNTKSFILQVIIQTLLL